MHHAHAPAAAAAGSLDDDWIADGLGGAQNLLRVFRQCAFRTGHAGHTSCFHGVLGGHLVAHQADCFRARADKDKARGLDAFGKIGIFRKKTIAGMNCFGIGNFRCRDDRRYVEVTLAGRCRADADGLIGQFDVFCVAVSLRVNDNGLDAQFTAGALNAECDFATVGDQDFPEHGGISPLTDDEQGFAEFHRLAVFNQNGLDDAGAVGLDFVEQLHRFNNAQCLADLDGSADLDKRLGARAR